MNKELLKILSGNNNDVDNQKLIDYLSNKLDDTEKHDLEKLMIESGLVNDAVEGLEEFKNKQTLAAVADQLNADLQKQLQKKISRKQKRKLKDQPWLYLTIVLVILLIIIGYLVIKKQLDSDKLTNQNHITLVR